MRLAATTTGCDIMELVCPSVVCDPDIELEPPALNAGGLLLCFSDYGRFLGWCDPREGIIIVEVGNNAPPADINATERFVSIASRVCGGGELYNVNDIGVAGLQECFLRYVRTGRLLDFVEEARRQERVAR